MKSIENFFLFCSGSVRSTLKRAPSDTNRISAIGATVFFTAVFAGLTSAYAFNFIFESTIATLVISILWAALIFNLDRFIVLSMKYTKKGIDKYLQAIPRIVLACLIAIVIAKPFELKLFESEIEKEILVMNQEETADREGFILQRFKPLKEEINIELAQIDQTIERSLAHLTSLEFEATKEADGTGGSLQKNLGPIYKLKKENADLALAQHTQLVTKLTPRKDSILNSKALLMDRENQQIMATNLLTFDGLSSRLEALSRLSTKKKSIRYASWFIMLLLIAIEIAPILTKLISKEGPYDYLLDGHEEEFRRHHTLKTKKGDFNLEQQISQFGI